MYLTTASITSDDTVKHKGTNTFKLGKNVHYSTAPTVRVRSSSKVYMPKCISQLHQSHQMTVRNTFMQIYFGRIFAVLNYRDLNCCWFPLMKTEK